MSQKGDSMDTDKNVIVAGRPDGCAAAIHTFDR